MGHKVVISGTVGFIRFPDPAEKAGHWLARGVGSHVTERKCQERQSLLLEKQSSQDCWSLLGCTHED